MYRGKKCSDPFWSDLFKPIAIFRYHSGTHGAEIQYFENDCFFIPKKPEKTQI